MINFIKIQQDWIIRYLNVENERAKYKTEVKERSHKLSSW